jgi:hypothetical protein
MLGVMSARAREGEASDGRMSRLDVLLLALGVASLAVLPWLVDRWPAEEEPRRLAIAHALLGADRPDSPHAVLLPGTAAAQPVLALVAAAGPIIGVAAAGRLVCSLAIAGLCMAQWLLLRRLAPQRWTNIHLLLPLSTGPLLLRGGTPLMLGLALGLTAVALIAPLVREPDRPIAPHWPHAAVAAVLLATAGVTAPLALLLCTAALLLLTGRGLLARRVWPLAVLLALAALPGISRAVEEMLAAPHGPPWVHARLDDRVLGILGADLATFSVWEAALRRLPVLCLVAGAGLAIRRGGQSGPGTVRLVAGALAIALLMPTVAGLPPCSVMAADALLWTACALAAPLSVGSRAIGAAGMILAASLTLIQIRAMAPAAAAIEQVLAVGRSIPRGARVLPLRFGGGPAIDPLRHAWAYVAVERDIVTPFLAGGAALLSCASPLPAPALAHLPHLGEDAAHAIESIDPHRCAGVTEPAIDCGCTAWKATRYAALLEAAAAYDRLLVIAPPDDLLAAGRDVLVPLARSGDVHLYALRAAPGAPHLLCEP